MSTTRITKKISSLISTQLPEYISFEFPVFRTFIEKYYNFIEQDQQAQELLQNALLYADIDSTINSLLDIFSEQFTKNIPKDILADKKLFIKLASELYTRKGTEEAYRIFFRALFNEEIDFFYPGTVILKPSDGKWETPHVIRVKPGSGSPFDLAGTKITGNTSNASAIIESVISFESGQNTIYELSVNETSIEGSFVAGENIIGARLTNAKSNAKVVTSAQIYSILSSVDVVYGATGYSVNDPITITGTTGTGARGYVGAVSDFGSIRKIVFNNYGYNYTTKPNISIGSPTASYPGIYERTGNIVNIRLNSDHGLTLGSNVNITFTGNSLNSLNNQTKKLTLTSIIDSKAFSTNVAALFLGEILSSTTIVTIDNNVITSDYFTNPYQNNNKGNVNLVHTLEKFFLTPFRLSDNVIRLSVPIDHGLKIGDNVKIVFNSIDTDTYTGNFALGNYNNVTVGFSVDHGLNISEKINVAFNSNYSNTNSGIYEISSVFSGGNYKNNANIYLNIIPHYYATGQNVNVNFKETLTNAIVGSFLLEGSNATVFLDSDHNFVLNENVNVSFSAAKLIDDNNKVQILGNANISLASNILLGNNTEFTSNIFAGNVISVGRVQEFVVANVVSNTIAYLTSNAEQTFSFANVYQATSNLNSNTTVVQLYSIPNKRRVFFNLYNRPNTFGCVLLSSNISNATLNTFATATVTNNGYPTYNFITISLPDNFSNANTRGNVTVRNHATSNIIGFSANNITISSIPNSRTIVFESNISSNLRYSNGTATVTVSLPNNDNVIYHEGSLTTILGDTSYLTGDLITYDNYGGTNYGVYSVPNANTITLVSHQPNTRGKLYIEFNKLANLQANVGAVGIGEGNWRDHSSILDETFRLQGRVGTNTKVYYQPFSYVIKSTKALPVWENAIKETIHPAGMEIFSEVSISTRIKDVQNVIAKPRFYPVKVLGNIDCSFTSITIDSLEYRADNLT